MRTIENDIPEIFLELAREAFALGLTEVHLGFWYIGGDVNGVAYDEDRDKWLHFPEALKSPKKTVDPLKFQRGETP